MNKSCFGVILLMIFLIDLLAADIFSQPLATRSDKFIGNVISNGFDIHSNFSKYWNQVTPENAGKWGSVEFGSGNYTWTQLDNIYNYAINNGFMYRHHVLIWGAQQPSFLESLDSAQQYESIVNWIKETGERYPEADFCEVVNEPLHQPPVYKEALGGDGETGWDWVIKSFELAREYWSPDTKLLINEYSVINSSQSNADYLEIINLLKERGLIDGIGVQGHNFEVNGGATPQTLEGNLENLTATGLPVYITEFDINESDDSTQLEKYRSIFPALYEVQGVEGITFWGYIEGEMWQTDAYLLAGQRFEERPAMEWLRTYLKSPFRPKLISPLGSTTEQKFVWHSVDSADTYNVQVSSYINFSILLVDTTVSDTTLEVNNLSSNRRFYWRVRASNDQGTGEFSYMNNFKTGDLTGIEEAAVKIPEGFKLYQNYPNPFNPETQINYYLPEAVNVTLEIFDVLGRHIQTLVNSQQSAGQHSVTFNGVNLSSGIYFYRLSAGAFVEVKRMLLTK